MKDNFINKYDHYELLLFIAGIVSTFQAVTFHGITLFSWFLLLLLFLGIAEKRGEGKIDFADNRIMLSGLVIITMTITEVITVFLDEYPEWTGRSLKNYVLMLAVFLLFFVLKRWKKYGDIYFRGMMVSCVIQYLVCYLEYILYRFYNYDLVDSLFEIETGMRDERTIVYGLTTNPGMLVPVVLIGLCLSGNRVCKVMALTAGILINSSTCMVCIAVYFFFVLFTNVREKAVSGWDFQKITLMVIAVAVIVLLAYEPLRNTLIDLYNYLIRRIALAAAGKNISTSSEGKHFRYYWSLPYIFDHIDLLRKIFGFGKNCSGIPFIELYKQYTDELWIPESDPIATLYDVGIAGLVAMYALLGKIAVGLRRENRYMGIFMICVLIGGVFYGFQMTWVLLFELIIWNNSRGETGVEGI